MALIPSLLAQLSVAPPLATGAFALSVLCLTQHVARLRERRTFRERDVQRHGEVLGLEREVMDLSRERVTIRLENQVLREILTQDDPSRGYGVLLRRITSDTEGNFAVIVKIDTAKQSIFEARGLSDASATALTIDAAVLKNLREGKPLILEDQALRSLDLYQKLSPPDRRKVRRLFAFPVGQGSELRAVLLTTQLLPAGAQVAEQLELTQRLMDCIATNLKQIFSLEQHQHQLRCTRDMLELRAMADSQSEQPGVMIERFLNRLLELTGGDRALLSMMTTDDGGICKPMARCGQRLSPGIESKWHEHEDTLVRMGQLYGERTPFDAAHLERVGVDTLIRSAVTIPVRFQKKFAGILCLTFRQPKPESPVELQLLEGAAEILSETLDRSINYLQIERQARQDGLTKLGNRRTFDAQLKKAMEDVQSGHERECSLLLCDLDRFKRINDRYGHQAGDLVLQESAKILQLQIGKTRSPQNVILARYGGEELAILMPGVGTAGAVRVAESIREAIAGHLFSLETGAIHVTLSLGVATCPNAGTTPTSLLKAADSALYAAKEGGRNRVCVADLSPLSSGDFPVMTTSR